MRVRVGGARLALEVFSRLHPDESVTVFAHILSRPFLSFLLELPRETAELSEVYLSAEKTANEIAARRLRERGFRVFMVPGLHAKALLVGMPPRRIVIGSANFTARALTNIELVAVVDGATAQIIGAISRFKGRVRDLARPVF